MPVFLSALMGSLSVGPKEEQSVFSDFCSARALALAFMAARKRFESSDIREIPSRVVAHAVRGEGLLQPGNLERFANDIILLNRAHCRCSASLVARHAETSQSFLDLKALIDARFHLVVH